MPRPELLALLYGFKTAFKKINGIDDGNCLKHSPRDEHPSDCNHSLSQPRTFPMQGKRLGVVGLEFGWHPVFIPRGLLPHIGLVAGPG